MPASRRSCSALSLGDQPLDLLLDRRQADELLELGHRVTDLDLGHGEVGHAVAAPVAATRTPSAVGVAPAAGERGAPVLEQLRAHRVDDGRRRPEDAGQVVEVAGPARAGRRLRERRQAGDELGDLGGHRHQQADGVDLAVHHAAGQPAAVVRIQSRRRSRASSRSSAALIAPNRSLPTAAASAAGSSSTAS